MRLLCYCLTVFSPSKEFATHLAWWVRQEPVCTLGAQYNLNGLLARSLLVGCVAPTAVPRMEVFDATGRVSYTKHWVGKTWNGDGLNEVLGKVETPLIDPPTVETEELIFFLTFIYFFQIQDCS